MPTLKTDANAVTGPAIKRNTEGIGKTKTRRLYQIRPKVVDKKTETFGLVSKKNWPKRENANIQENDRHTQSNAESVTRQANKEAAEEHEAAEKREAEHGRDSVRKHTFKPQEFSAAPGQRQFKNRSVCETRDYNLSGRTIFSWR